MITASSLRIASALALVTVVAIGAACGSAGGLDFPGTPEGGKALVEALQKSTDMPAMIAKLKPTKEDVAALFDAGVVGDIMAHVDKMFADLGGLGGKDGQTEVLFRSATTEDFRADNDAAGKFPGGYTRMADKLAPGVTWYAWKFVKPGEKSGMGFDGLTYVNGHWVWIPKPFRAVDH